MDVILIRKEAKQLEASGQWFEAAKKWQSIGHTGDYDACMLIFNGTASGDKFRAKVKAEFGDEPDKENNAHAWVKWYDGMSRIYNEMFLNN